MKKIKSRKLRFKYRSLLKVVAVFVLAIIGLTCVSYVDAGMNDSKLVRERIDDIYAISTINGESRMFYLDIYKINGKVTYCIDLGVSITTDLYHSTHNFFNTNLSEEQVQYIRLASYFGYLYDNHNDYRYYMAAQELIWEYLFPNAEIEWIDELKVDGQRINVDSYKKEILELSEWFIKTPCFDVADSYTVGEEIVLTDKCNVLSGYRVSVSKDSSVSIEGNNLRIKVANKIMDDRIILTRNFYYSYASSLYYYDNSQRLISNGNMSNINKYIYFKIEGASFEGQVIDKDTGSGESLGQASLEEAVYEIYNEDRELIGTYETDENGKFKVDNLLFGTYYIKQIKASEGYLINNEEVKFEFLENNTELKLEQEVIKNTIRINKLFGNDGKYISENGIIFEIYDNNDKLYKTLTTNEKGETSIALPYGTYRLHQSNTTLGYSTVDDFNIEVTEQKSDEVNYNLFNEFLMTKIRVITLDKDNNKVLGKVSYKIRKKSDNTYLSFDSKNVFTTDDKGELLMPILFSYGDYILEQVKVPEGFLLNEELQEITIDGDSSFSLLDDNLVMDIVVYNNLIMGKVNVIANEEEFYYEKNNYGYQKNPRGENSFSLIANEDIIVNGKVKYHKGEEVYNGKTDKDGQLIIDNLYLGSYCLVDESTNEQKCFVLESTNNRVETIEENLEFTKELLKGDIIINNISNEGVFVPGAVFEVFNEKNEVIYTGVTNEEGIIKVNDILVGSYCIRQKSVPDNVKKNNKDICFELEEEKKIEFVNETMISSAISVPNTFLGTIGIYEMIVILVMIGTGIFVYKKIFVGKLYR